MFFATFIRLSLQAGYLVTADFPTYSILRGTSTATWVLKVGPKLPGGQVPKTKRHGKGSTPRVSI